MRIKPKEFIRSFSFENKYCNSDYITNFNKYKFEENPKILELLQLLGETSNNFLLTEKESFYIKNVYSKNYLLFRLCKQEI
jgi:hypothetical protein